MYIEKEIKLPIELEIAKRIFNNKEFRYEKGVFQRTVRMDTLEEDFEKKGIFIRTREEDLENIVTLKQKIENSDKDVFSRKEYETTIGDAQIIREIFEILGLKKSWIMEKYRIQGKYKNVTITLDELPFGLFMEIEGDTDNILKTCEELELNINKKFVVSYWDLWDIYKKEHNINAKKTNIIFSNKEYQLKKIEGKK